MKEDSKTLKRYRRKRCKNCEHFLQKKKADLKEERDKVIELKHYTRHENLKFHNILESEEEGVNHSPKQVIFSILQKEFQMDTAQIRFHRRSSSNWQAK